MKLVIQRVKRAQVEVKNEVIGKINNGFLVLLGIVSTFIYFVVVNPEYEKPIVDVLVNSIK